MITMLEEVLGEVVQEHPQPEEKPINRGRGGCRGGRGRGGHGPWGAGAGFHGVKNLVHKFLDHMGVNQEEVCNKWNGKKGAWGQKRATVQSSHDEVLEAYPG